MGSEIHGLRPDMPFRDAAKPAIGKKLDELFEHEAGTRAGEDIEELHDMRVASRRLRAAMDVFAVCFPPKTYRPLHKMAARLTRALGEVRDRDVMIESLERYKKKAPAEEGAGIADLIGTVKDERAVYRAKMLQTLDEVDQAGFRHHLYIVLMHEGQGNGNTAKKGGLNPRDTLQTNAQLIGVERAANLYGFVPYIHDPANAVELHEMRIAAKHLRYALEIFRVCFGPDIDDRIADVKETQEQIGQIHDCDVLIEVLQRHHSVIAQRMHEELVAIAVGQSPYNERMACMNASIQQQQSADPRPGILSLLARKIDERNRRYTEFIRWWDEQQQNNMRGKLYSCLAAVNGLKVES
ncbi:MAG: domain containing protein [Chloroflexi bacterium]|nr:domain containing protein [Chloroflexota bacterium]